MNITISLRHGDLDVAITHTPGATVEDLLLALCEQRVLDDVPENVLIDGRAAPLDHGLDEVGCRNGVRVTFGSPVPSPFPSPLAGARGPAQPANPTDVVHDVLHLVVAGGVDAGRRVAMAPGRVRVGRGADAVVSDPTIQDRHATLDVEPSGRATLTDHGSRTGTWVDGHRVRRTQPVTLGQVVRAGALSLRLEAIDQQDRPQAVGPAFNRPPRPAPPAPGPAMPAPARPSVQGTRPALPVAGVIGGVAMGSVMWLVTGTATYAILAFLTPLLGVGTAVAARRRHGRDGRVATTGHRRALREFADAVVAASDEEAARLRTVHPDLGEVVRRALGPSTRLWERRPGHADAFHVVLGHATHRWDPPVQPPAGGQPADEVAAILDHEGWLRDVPVVAPGGVIGIVGDRRVALAVARSIVAQVVVHHGPADVETLLVTPDPLAWEGAKWLPHGLDPCSGRPRAADPVAGRELLGELLQGRRATSAPTGAPNAGDTGDDHRATILAVLDGVEVCEGRDAPGRAVLRGEAGPVVAVVLAPSVDRLPSSCETVVVLEGAHGAARVVRPGQGTVVRGVLVSGLSEERLAAVGRALARLEDPEATGDGDLPVAVALPDLLVSAGGTDPLTAAGVRNAWRRQREHGRLRTPIGATVEGPLMVDLGADGPHALVAGTTGAGKSELLRSLVAGLAATTDPDHVSFVLVDYKGGAAFDRCADLPHVVGLVTDLDDDLAERALTCLRAELHHRERLLRSAGVGDLDGWRRSEQGRCEPLPDLLVVIDEFATLAAELPDFLDSLVGIAQRGRSLGVHLVLATQRPAGVVSDDIRANTNLRIALRVQDRQDSTDVIEDPRAATLTRDQPGRAYVRLGPDVVVPMQAALVTGTSPREAGPVRVAPFALGAVDPSAHDSSGSASKNPLRENGPSHLDLLVEAVCAAHREEGLADPRQPWPAPLPTLLPADRLPTASAATPSSVATLALADDPAHQRQVAAGWDLDAGSLLLVGALGSGTTSTLATAAHIAAMAHAPSDLHLYALDAGRGGLASLDVLPHCAGVVRLGDQERLARLVGRLAAEVDRRRTQGGQGQPRIVLLVDDWEAFATAHELGPGAALLDELTRVVIEGPGVGIVSALTVGRPGGITQRLLSSFDQRWIFRLPDDSDAAGLGVRGTSRLVPGRCIDASSGRLLQVVWRPAEEAIPTGESMRDHAGPDRLDVLPRTVELAGLPQSDLQGSVWRLVLGLGGDDLEPQALHLHEGEHALVAGPARSGRTTALAVLATAALAEGTEVLVAAVRPGGLSEVPGVRVIAPTDLPGALTEVQASRLVLVDDAEQVEVVGLDHALANSGPLVRLVAAARTDAVRTGYGHWLRTVARSRAGVLLQPDLDLDGDLLGARLPRRAVAPPAAGRGFLIDGGVAAQCQVAVPAAAIVLGRAA